MAGSTTVVDLLVKAKDLASAPIRGIVASIQFLDSEISVVAGKMLTPSTETSPWRYEYLDLAAA